MSASSLRGSVALRLETVRLVSYQDQYGVIASTLSSVTRARAQGRRRAGSDGLECGVAQMEY